MSTLAAAAAFQPNGHLESFWGLREPLSAISHALAAIAALVGFALLWRRSRGDRGKQLSMAVFSLSMVVLFACSSLYHSLALPQNLLDRFRRLDHSAVFLLIAGTFTPFYVNAARGWWRTGNLILIWAVAFLGIGLKVAFINMPDALSSGMYVAMGWLALIGYFKLAEVLSHRVMAWTAVGGVVYSLGAIVDAIQWPVPLPGYFGFHEVLHILVVLGSVVHYLVVYHYVTPLDAQIVFAPEAAPVPA
ncbi:MAG: PAQR family membrane homeostasis protein TrhA [Planctomycetota bacterium]